MNIHDTLQYQNVGLPEDILRCKLRGDHAEAIRLIDLRLQQNNIPQALRHSLEVHREMILRLAEEFPYSMEDALTIVQDRILDFTMEELQSYMDSRDIRWIYIDGEKRIFNRFFSSMCKAVAGFGQRANAKIGGVESATTGTPEANRLDIAMHKIKTNGSLSNRIRIRATVKLKDEHFTTGMFIRAHLPIPAACQQQSDIRIEKMYPETGIIAPEDAPQRTICWEENIEENHEFMVEYSYLHTARYTPAYGAAGAETSLTCDTEEKAPQLVFTPYIRSLCDELCQGAASPLEKAQRFYDFITKNMHYTFMPGYFVLDNIAENCALNFTGDCGVFALLFLTLCRCAGIPAQWQSGLTVEPDFIGGHDWVRFYAEPFGWIFADTSYGVSANRVKNEERRQFYFGNLDAYRMVANREFQENFTVPKEQWRADPYDNQLGEMESADHGYTLDEFLRTKEVLTCEEE